jgi:tetratricopeptide (TPR) repeat protein
VDRNSGIPDDERTAALDAAVTPDIERALQIDPGNAHAWYVRGRLLRGTGRFEASAGAFQRAVELDPNHAAATLALSAAALSAGRQDERFRLATRALDLDPMAPANHIAAATFAWILGRRDDLRATVERMRVLFPGNPGVATVACQSILRLGEPDEALACLELERDRFKAQPAFVANLDWLAGETSEAIGRNDWALAFYDRAASRNPDAAVAAMRLRNDVAGLRQHAMEALESGRATNFSGLTMAAAGLSDESVALFRANGIDRILDSNSPYKPMAIDDVLVLVALLRQRDEAAEADRLLAQATEYNETMRRHGARAAVIRLHATRAYALGGRRDDALEQFAFAVNAMDSPFPLDPIERDPSLAAIRDDTRFQTQLQVVRDRQARAQARLPATFARHGLAWTPP